MEIIKKLSILGIVFSIVWVSIASFVYFDAILHYPHCIVEHYNLPIYDYFEAVDDDIRKDEAMKWAADNGTEADAKMLLNMGFRFIKPTFKPAGYFKFVFLPVVVIWGILIFFLLQ